MKEVLDSLDGPADVVADRANGPADSIFHATDETADVVFDCANPIEQADVSLLYE